MHCFASIFPTPIFPPIGAILLLLVFIARVASAWWVPCGGFPINGMDVKYGGSPVNTKLFLLLETLLIPFAVSDIEKYPLTNRLW